MERSTRHHFGSSVGLIIGLVTVVAATVAVMAFVKHARPASEWFFDDWDEIVGM
jgi:hypothetical protein